MDKSDRGDHAQLIGRTIERKYVIESIIKPTRKSWVFKAYEPSLDRHIALKILIPWMDDARKKQVIAEGKRLARLEQQEHITSVYAAGEDQGFYYIAMQYVDGKDLEQDLDSGKQLSLAEIIEIVQSVAAGVANAHNEGIHHLDVKLENIIRKNGKGKGLYLLDWGGRLSDSHSFSPTGETDIVSNPFMRDIAQLGGILKYLLERYKSQDRKVPKALEHIAQKALSFGYDDVKEFGQSIAKYQNAVSRRKFMGIMLGTLVSGAAAISIYEHNSYRSSIEYIQNEIAGISALDNRELAPLYNELLSRIVAQKIRKLGESGTFGPGNYLYATTTDGKWFKTHGNGYSTEGYTPGLCWICLDRTKEKEFGKWARETTEGIDFVEDDAGSVKPARFYYSYGKGYIMTGNEGYLANARRAADIMASSYNGKNPSERQHYLDIIMNHLQTLERYSIRRDSSVREQAVFNPRKGKFVGEANYFAFGPGSAYSRGHARALEAFVTAYQKTGIFCKPPRNWRITSLKTCRKTMFHSTILGIWLLQFQKTAQLQP